MLREKKREGMSGAHILAVLVLYKRAPEESEAFTSLRSILWRRPDLAGGISLLVYDNSPIAHEIPALPITTRYVSNTGNAGLAPAYNAGLQLAGEDALDWLLLLDQDTLLNEAYLTEAIRLTHAAGNRFQAIVPKLVEGGLVLSPHLALTLRHPKPVDITTHGISTVQLHPYNSGAVLRVKALQEMNGFPGGFLLDYLDHVTFRTLQTKGGRLFVMQTTLEHKLSTNEADRTDDPVLSARQKNILQAEHAFYRSYGTSRERFYHHLRLIWKAWKALRSGSFRRSILLLKTAITP
jgi:GT2 family glycosyltransferase